MPHDSGAYKSRSPGHQNSHIIPTTTSSLACLLLRERIAADLLCRKGEPLRQLGHREIQPGPNGYGIYVGDLEVQFCDGAS